MITILLTLLFFVIAAISVLLIAWTVSAQPPGEARQVRDPFAPILRAGSPSDDAMTIKMLPSEVVPR